eukprot:tig00000789_g4131.t1
MAVRVVNPNAEVARQSQALLMNISAAKGLQDVLKSNLGPKGTIKMLVSGAGDIKLTKDGAVLLHEMQIQNATAQLIARAATAQDDIAGDGTTSNVLIVGELLKQCERFLAEGVHPRVLADGIEQARKIALEALDKCKRAKDTNDRELLHNVAKTALRTKLHDEVADLLTDIVVDAVLTIRRPGQPIDLFMIEIMHMMHRTETETKLVKGIVMDHGARHPDMKTKAENCFILTCNVSFEYEKTEVNSGFFYNTAEMREKMVDAERKLTDERVRKVIELKRTVCDTPDKNFVVINQKGIDPPSLDMFAKEGIIALRRAKRRNMERLTLACGGIAVNSVEDMTPDVLGHADNVYEHVLGEDKYTFVEGVKNPFSCTILVKAPSRHSIAQIKDAIRDGLRAVKNTIEDGSVVPGAGAFEVMAHKAIMDKLPTISGKAKLGAQCLADALLIVPKILAENSGYDTMETIIKLQDEFNKNHVVGLDLSTGNPTDPETAGVWDQYRVKRQLLNSSPVIAVQLLLVDEVIKAGKNMGRQE